MQSIAYIFNLTVEFIGILTNTLPVSKALIRYDYNLFQRCVSQKFKFRTIEIKWLGINT
ncbi:MAG: hypothetical protein MUF42_14095 [Cytophagaceae bacterium]|jgi:hypothetical protein|nr:hypothetical protein [Cytophagaceae bacterium]